MTDPNPFFTDAPVVYVVTAVRRVDGVLVESPWIEAKRVWARINESNRVDLDAPSNTSVDNRIPPDHPPVKLRQFDR